MKTSHHTLNGQLGFKVEDDVIETSMQPGAPVEKKAIKKLTVLDLDSGEEYEIWLSEHAASDIGAQLVGKPRPMIEVVPAAALGELPVR